MNIENKKQIVTMGLAVALGLLAVFLTSQYVEKSIQAGIKEQAKLGSAENQALKQNLSKAIQQIDKLNKNQQLMAQQLRERPKIVAQAQQTTTVAPKVPTVDSAVFSVKTPPGKRAITVQIDSLSAVGGLVNPGDYVDIIAHLKVPDGPDPKMPPNDVTTVLFQDVQVLAVGTNFKPVGNALTYAAQQKSSKLKVTFALTAEEAALLSFANENGNFRLSLRSPTEQGKQNLQIASWDTLSEYVKEVQGTELTPPKKPRKERVTSDVNYELEDEEEPYIQIFSGGREL